MSWLLFGDLTSPLVPNTDFRRSSCRTLCQAEEAHLTRYSKGTYESVWQESQTPPRSSLQPGSSSLRLGSIILAAPDQPMTPLADTQLPKPVQDPQPKTMVAPCCIKGKHTPLRDRQTLLLPSLLPFQMARHEREELALNGNTGEVAGRSRCSAVPFSGGPTELQG